VVGSMYASAPDDELHIQHYLSANCFGDHFTRTGVDIRTRELLTFAMLISVDAQRAQGDRRGDLRVSAGSRAAPARERTS
jgi:4-carboxymuconolactone decarboxylase